MLVTRLTGQNPRGAVRAETPDTVYLALPGRSADVETGEISGQELESLAGDDGLGGQTNWGSC
jgi:hypothetical protein